MTIIEILIVIALIGTILTIIMTNVLNKNNEAKIDLTTVQEKKIGENLDFYKLHVGRYPKTEDGLMALLQAPSEAKNWRGPYIEADKLEDPWGQKLTYRDIS
ncbi:MAG: type II secretion system protein GspG [Oligoflexus sp.]|nr:type II secretion system protein GspG [Oligoflexus sp.]